MKASINPSVPRGCCHHGSARAQVDGNAAADNSPVDGNAGTEGVSATAASMDGNVATSMNSNAITKPKRSKSKAEVRG